MRIVAVFMFLTFLVFCGLQYNDPDTWVWVSIYAYPALLAILYAFGRRYFVPSLIGAVVYICAAFLWMPYRAASYAASEEAREAGGLLIAGVWMVTLALFARKSKQALPSR